MKTNTDNDKRPFNEKQKLLWLELPQADTVEQRQVYCDLVNAVLNKLGVEGKPFEPANEGNKYNAQYFNANRDEYLNDDGIFFDLEYLAKVRDLETA